MIRFAFSWLLPIVIACGGDDAPPDGGGGRDGATPRDGGGARDAGGGVDGGPDRDGGPDGRDGGRVTDGGGRDAGRRDGGPPGPCGDDLGAPCDDSHACAASFVCEVGRCVPQGRETCGGFAGALCTLAPYLECVFFSSADYGPCVTAEERACLCEPPSPGFSCF